MTKETFVKIIRSVIEDKGVRIFDSKASKLNAVGRRYESGSVSIPEAMEEIKVIFADEYGVDRHAYGDIEKALKRY